MKAMIRSITLSDFGPFEGSHTFNFDGPGTYAICAPNGSGKSHIVLGAKITASPNCELENPMGSYVNGAGRGAKSAKIVAVYDVDGEEMEVTRRIALNKADEDERREAIRQGVSPHVTTGWRIVYKGKKYTKGSDCQELLENLFGVGNRTQEDAIFVMQDDAGAIIKATPGVRSKALQYLSGAEVCQKAADIAQRKLSNLRVIDRAAELEEKQEKLGNLRELTGATAEVIKGLLEVVLPEEDVSNMRLRLQASGLAQERATDYLKVKAELDVNEREQTRVAGELVGSRESLATAVSARAELQVEFDEACEFVASHAANAKLAEQRQTLLAQSQRLEAEPDDNQSPTPPEITHDSMTRIEADVKEMNESTARSRQFLEVFESTGRCPTCHSKPENVEELVQSHRTVVSTNEPILAKWQQALQTARTLWTQYDKDEAAHRTWQEGWLQRVEDVAGSLAETADYPVTDAAALTARQTSVSKFKLLVAEITTVTGSITVLEAVEVRVGAAIKHQREQCATFAEDATKVLSAEEAANLRVLIDKDKVNRDAVSHENGKRSAQITQGMALVEEVKAMEEAQVKVAKKLKVAEFLEGLKSVMHHAAIPHDRSIVYLEGLNKLMANYCGILHAPFTLYVDPDTQNFLVVMDGEVKPAYQLSGGQKTIAAWAWHLALYEKHGSQLDFLWMDEPTTGLDDVNLINIGEAVRHLTRHCHGSGLQFIMVTHEANLAAVFDTVIRLDS